MLVELFIYIFIFFNIVEGFALVSLEVLELVDNLQEEDMQQAVPKRRLAGLDKLLAALGIL